MKLNFKWIYVRYIISIPFIYGVFLPAVFFHLVVEIYHQVCFRLYGIPLVKASDYFIYDRPLLKWLNPWEKINCYYCSYVNNLIRYGSEIAGRTERYWCPLKYHRVVPQAHSQYDQFLVAEAPVCSNKKGFRLGWDKLREFSDFNKK